MARPQLRKRGNEMAKRGNGEGSIYQRNDGVWCTAYLQPNGKRRLLYARGRKEVGEKLREALAAADKGASLPVRRETLAHFLERWLRDVAPLRVRAKTLLDYRGDVDRYIEPGLGKLRLNEVTPTRVQQFINALSARGLGPDTVAHVRAVLRVALSQAQREEIITQNAAKLVQLPKIRREEIPALAAEAARGMITAFAGHDYEALITLCLATGLRQGEALGLGWEDVDLEAGSISVRRQLQRLNRRYQLVELKTARSRRTLSLPPVAVAALRRHRARQGEWRLKLGAAWLETGRIFTTATGDYLNGSTVTHRFRQQLARTGLEGRRFHDLRHGAASLLLAEGASMRVVMEQLGHSHISLTMNNYAHIAPAQMVDAAKRLQSALGGD